jgi:hypothetical protein
VAHTFDDLVEKQRVADGAHTQVLALQEEHGRPTHEGGWTDEQTAAYVAAWTSWRVFAADAQAAVTKYAATEGKARDAIEHEVKKVVRHAGKVPA